METDNNSLEWNIRTLMVSLFQVAFSEIEANIMSGAQKVNVYVNKKPSNNREDQITDNNECVDFYKSVRDAEYNKLVDAYAREKIIKEERERNRITREQENVISAKEITDDDECAAFYKSVRDAEYDKLVEAYAREKIIKEEKERKRIRTEQEQIISAKEITDDDECAAFYKSVRDAEYDKLVEAYAREIKEEKERNRITREQEQIKTQFEEFWKPATDLDSLRRVSREPNDSIENDCMSSKQELHLKKEQTDKIYPEPFLSPVKEERIKSFVREQNYNYESFQRTDMRNTSIDRIKELDTSVIRETVPNKRGYIQRIVKKVFKRSRSSTKDIKDNQLALKEELKLDLSTLDDYIEDDDIPDTSRTSDSEWFSISLSDTEETPRPHLKPFFSPVVEEIHVSTITSKTKDSTIDIEVDFQSKPNSGFTSFRQWFCQLFCCHSKPDEDFDN